MSYAEELEAWTQYRNSHAKAQEHYEPDELEQFEQDMEKARAAMERAYLEDTARKEPR